jgi:hypothetical protein
VKPRTIRVRVMHAGRPDLDRWEDVPFDPKVVEPTPEPEPVAVEIFPPQPPARRPGPTLRELIHGPARLTLADRLEQLHRHGPGVVPAKGAWPR